MFYLHVSNRTENLLTQLAEVIRVDKQKDLFSKELFLIQSQGMERMVAQTMADEFKSFCNFKFFLPFDFLNFIAGQIGVDTTTPSYTREHLSWRLEGLLREVDKELYLPLQNYLFDTNADLKRYQLATRLASVFDQYQIMRPEMLESWAKGKPVTNNRAELWQMDLWVRLLKQLEGVNHRGILFHQVIDFFQKNKEVALDLPKRISLVGLHILPPVYLDFLSNVAGSMDVHFLLLSPCRNYWDRSESRRTILLNNEAIRTGEFANVLEDQHPLLRNLGRQGRDLQDMMLVRTDITAEFSSYESPVSGNLQPDNSTLLERLQSDLLDGSSPQAVQEIGENDDSVKIVSCHSKQRELMVLKDNLLRLLYTNDDLELRDIVVMAPDIQEYSGLISAFFNDIQHSIADRSLRRRNSAIQSFVTFLNLIGGRYGWNEVMGLLRQTAVFPQFDLTISDVDRLQEWVIGAGIRWGLSGSQRQQAGGADIEEASWRAGIDRLLMGYAIDAENFVDDILPYTHLEGQGALPLGGLCQFIQILDQAEHQFTQRYTLGEWSKLLQTFVQLLFGEGTDNDLGELRALVAELSDLYTSADSPEISFEVIRKWFEKSTSESRSSSGFLRGQLTFCSMLPMRSIPFRVVCLLGLNDGVFPSNDTHDTFDLMADSFRLGDRSPRADDRYQFLEAILSARSNLYLSYVGRSIKTNKEIPPSVVVTELLELLENYYGLNNCVINHPLHPFSASYFDGSHPEKFSYNKYYLRTAEILQQDSKKDEKWLQSTLQPVEVVVELHNLFNFFKNPQKYFVRNCLGINPGIDDVLPDENEIFEIQGLDKYKVEQELLCAVEYGGIETLGRKLQHRGQWILGSPGQLLMKKWQDEVEDFYQKIVLLQIGKPLAEMPIDLAIGRYRLVGNLPDCYERGAMVVRYGKLRGTDLLRGWLIHQILQNVSLEKWTRVIAQDKVIVFSNKLDKPPLELLLDIYARGCEVPSKLFIEPAYAHLQQFLKTGSRIKALEAARKKYMYSLEKGYELEWQLLSSETDVTQILEKEFEELTELVIHQIWSNRDE